MIGGEEAVSKAMVTATRKLVVRRGGGRKYEERKDATGGRSRVSVRVLGVFVCVCCVFFIDGWLRQVISSVASMSRADDCTAHSPPKVVVVWRFCLTGAPRRHDTPPAVVPGGENSSRLTARQSGLLDAAVVSTAAPSWSLSRSSSPNNPSCIGVASQLRCSLLCE